jgi:hypothetical protein
MSFDRSNESLWTDLSRAYGQIQRNTGTRKHPETSSFLREFLNHYTYDWEFTLENYNREITQPLSTPIFGRASKACF